MKFNPASVTAFLLSVGSASCFTGPVKRPAFVVSQTESHVSQGGVGVTSSQMVLSHELGCVCINCSTMGTGRTTLYASVDEATEEAVPDNVMALDGVESAQEAHNVERPARKYISRKRGKPLSDFSIGDSVKATVKSFAAYGAFMDIGATTDGLLHISQVSKEYVSDVSEVLEEGQEVEVRITKIDEANNKVSLSLLTEEEAESQSSPRQQRNQNQSSRRDDSAVLAQLAEKGWNPEQFVEGTVVSTVDFGAFVRVDVSQLNEEVTGEMDGLVHISALSAGRVDKVTSVVNPDDKVQVRVRAISDRKVSLTMISPEDEQARADARADPADDVGNKEWKEDMAKLQSNMPTFRNGPVIVDRRK